MDTVLSIVMAALTGTLLQLIGIFGIFFILGFVLARLQHATHRHYTSLLGWRGLYFTAWIGTPVHELSHVLFAKIFRHRVMHISLFSPNQNTGGLGHIEHAYNPRSLYQQIGNAFIGAAPMLLGPLIVFGLFRWLVPEVTSVESLQNIDIHRWQLWLFVYLSFSIVAHLAPSKPDRNSMWHGILWLVLVGFLINIILLLLGIDPADFRRFGHEALLIYSTIFLYALGISVVHFLVTWVLFYLPAKLLRR